MAGHNKWSKVKHIKAKTDADMNAALRLALQKAKDVNMPKDNIKRAIEKGVGGGDGDALEEITYEGYAPGGIAVLIRALTDNKNRTVPNVRAALTKAGGQLANPGSVSYLFDKKGVIVFDSDSNSEQIMNVAIESGADDVDVQDDGYVEVVTEPDQFEQVVTAFNTENIAYMDATVQMVPQTRILLDLDKAKGFIKLIDKLEEDDDIQEVFHNADVPDEALEI